MANRAQRKKSCGNAGAVERVENQTQVFHSSHRPLEISPTPRDFHIPTAQAGRAWKSGKPKSGFPLSHPRPATMTTISFQKNQNQNRKQNQPRRLRRLKDNPKKESITQQSADFVLRFSGSPRIGIKTGSQAHSALESNIGFRLTFGLENAYANLYANREARAVSQVFLLTLAETLCQTTATKPEPMRQQENDGAVCALYESSSTGRTQRLSESGGARGGGRQ
jgi:hypothetical protein